MDFVKYGICMLKDNQRLSFRPLFSKTMGSEWVYLLLALSFSVPLRAKTDIVEDSSLYLNTPDGAENSDGIVLVKSEDDQTEGEHQEPTFKIIQGEDHVIVLMLDDNGEVIAGHTTLPFFRDRPLDSNTVELIRLAADTLKLPTIATPSEVKFILPDEIVNLFEVTQIFDEIEGVAVSNEPALPILDPISLSVNDVMDMMQPNAEMGTRLTGNLIELSNILNSGASSIVSPLGTQILKDMEGESVGQITILADGSFELIPLNIKGNSLDILNSGEALDPLLVEITIQDENGNVLFGDVSITLNGANDSPHVADVSVSVNDVMDDMSLSFEMGSLIIDNLFNLGNLQDVDKNDSHKIIAVEGDAILSISPSLALSDGLIYELGFEGNPVGTLQVGSDGSFDVSPLINFEGNFQTTNQALDMLGEGEELPPIHLTVTTQDKNGKTSQSNLAITFKGVNDAPIALDDEMSASVLNLFPIPIIADLPIPQVGPEYFINGLQVSTNTLSGFLGIPQTAPFQYFKSMDVLENDFDIDNNIDPSDPNTVLITQQPANGTVYYGATADDFVTQFGLRDLEGQLLTSLAEARSIFQFASPQVGSLNSALVGAGVPQPVIDSLIGGLLVEMNALLDLFESSVGQVVYGSNILAGEESFIYQVTDSGGKSAFADVRLAILPVPQDEAVEVSESRVGKETFVNIPILENENVLFDNFDDWIVSTTDTSNGTLGIGATDNIASYVPDLNFVGTDSFTYTLFDPLTGDIIGDATTTITVVPVIDENTEGATVGPLATLFPGVDPASITFSGATGAIIPLPGGASTEPLFVIENGFVRLQSNEALDVDGVGGGTQDIILEFLVDGTVETRKVKVEDNDNEGLTFDFEDTDGTFTQRNLNNFDPATQQIIIDIPSRDGLCKALEVEISPYSGRYVINVMNPETGQRIGEALLSSIDVNSTTEIMLGVTDPSYSGFIFSETLLLGDDFNNIIAGNINLDDIIFGLGGTDTIAGDEFNFGTFTITSSTTYTDDCLHGGTGVDSLYGDVQFFGRSVPNSPIEVTFGSDFLSGGPGADRISADIDSWLNPANPDLQVTLIFADDTLFGGEGDDLLSGDQRLPAVSFVPEQRGNDTFIYDFNIDNGDDTIQDFDFGQPRDINGNGTIDEIAPPKDRILIQNLPGDNSLVDDLAMSIDFDILLNSSGGNPDPLSGEKGGYQLTLLNSGMDTIFFAGTVDSGQLSTPTLNTRMFIDVDRAMNGVDQTFIVRLGTAGDDTGFDVIPAIGNGLLDFSSLETDINFGLDGNDALYGDFDSISNTIGGSFSDDYLFGGEGNDGIYGDANSSGLNVVVTASGGDDKLFGGKGQDLIIGDIGSHRGAILDTGNDTIFGGDGSDTIIGDVGFNSNDGSPVIMGTERGVRNTGDDILFGEAGDDFIFGDIQNSGGFFAIFNGTAAGNDTLEGGDDNDTLVGDAGDVSQEMGNAGNDTLLGGAGEDTLIGDVRNISSPGGRLVQAGQDILHGGTGVDQLHGDVQNIDRDYTGAAMPFPTSFERAAMDTFVFDFAINNGNDVIHDFNVAGQLDSGPVLDKIRLLDLPEADGTLDVSLGDLDAGVSFSISGGNYLMTLNNPSSDQITLSGFDSGFGNNGGVPIGPIQTLVAPDTQIQFELDNDSDALNMLSVNVFINGANSSAILEGEEGVNDLMIGFDGSQNIIGDLVSNTNDLGAFIISNDILRGGNDADLLVGDVLTNDAGGILGQGGNDILRGEEGGDTLVGDVVTNNGTVTKAGDDLLIGGLGDDNLYGDIAMLGAGIFSFAGIDTFRYDFSIQNGNDTIHDFNRQGTAGSTLGNDKLQFLNLSDVVGGGDGVNMDDLEALSSVTNNGGDVQVNMFSDTGNTVSVGSTTLIGLNFVAGPGGDEISDYADIGVSII